MPMKFSELYLQSLKLWPEQISIADGKPPSDSGSQFFPELCEISQSIEKRIDYATEHWKNVGHWSISQAVHEEAKRLYQLGETLLTLEQVSPERINYWVVVNIQNNPDWEIEFSMYEPYPA